MTRLETNREIIAKLAEMVERYPDQRFFQLLLNSDIVDEIPSMKFYEESSVTLDRLQTSHLFKEMLK